jgi:inosose dehydratase
MDLVVTMLVGTAAVNWGFDPLYTWVKLPAIEEMLDQMSATGYAGTEISYNFPRNVDALRALLSARNLRPAASFVAVDMRDRDKYEEALRDIGTVAERLHSVGSGVLILSDKPSAARLERAGRIAANGSDGLDNAGWDAMCTGFNRAGELLAKRGMRAVFHPHVGTFVETLAEIDRLCAATDPALIGLCPDTGHLAYAGVNPEDIFKKYAARIDYVHLKDVDRIKLAKVRAEGIDFVSAVHLGLFVELGTGAVPIGRIMATLRAAHYAGWLIVEQDAPTDPLGAAARNRAYLRAEFEL